jgi:BirA family transcriptional regulator, biotin operon repressor / biotin---[acetyl-CoA-carboxylase] ligase
LTSDLDRVRIEQILQQAGVTLGRPLSIAAVTGSTNDDAKAAAQAGVAAGAAFVADAQTAGRGRLGRAWHSPPGENLYVSFVLRPKLPTGLVACVTLAAGLAVADAVAPLVSSPVRLKWPNDVLLSDRKVAGVLCEAAVSEGRTSFVVVGIGLNVHTKTFPADLANGATSLAIAGAAALDRSSILVTLAAALARRVAMLDDGPDRIVRDFSVVDAIAGRDVIVDGRPAVAIGLGSDGRLRVREPDGTERSCAAGEVAVGTRALAPHGQLG